MNRHRSRKFVVAAVATFATFFLTACGTSFSAQTNQQYQPAVGANLRTGDVQVYNGLFVDNGDGTATFSGALLARGDATHELTGITVTPAGGSAIDIVPSTPVTLEPDQLVTLGQEGEVIVESSEITHGRYVTVVFMTDSGQATIDVPVVERTEMYDSVASEGAAAPEADDDTTESGDEGTEDGTEETDGAVTEETATEETADDA